MTGLPFLEVFDYQLTRQIHLGQLPYLASQHTHTSLPLGACNFPSSALYDISATESFVVNLTHKHLVEIVHI